MNTNESIEKIELEEFEMPKVEFYEFEDDISTQAGGGTSSGEPT